ncbi:WD repeat-containing protein [Eremomyces bilateralis CBS 781.70]|uniref:DNA damage-binding protein CMR1 n=1 Tax=Eremomyces bilateralis CBS 781.70 TaxID=1392243 RepID=A0A6G1GDG2_9PEZI|nr:WD repeat-containing protein [Eremomyces bilateralis CBS 781.70]KAF1816145.1 WD repeat-containing protein [Eremomyces bilateralis CBS 781.70]
MARASTTPISDYERQRQEKIAQNQALLRSLALDAASAGLGPSRPNKPTAPSSSKRKTAPKKEKEEVVPRRVSSRLRGIGADSEAAKRKMEEIDDGRRAAERAKRMRVSGELKLVDVNVGGTGWDGGFPEQFQRTFTVDDVKETADGGLRELRERMMGLTLWGDVEPNRIKLTPERVYSLTFHPNPEKPLVFAGDKLGNLGLFDGAQERPADIKAEDDDDDEVEEAPIAVTTFKIHTRTICAMQIGPADSNNLYTASYDSSIRVLDLVKGVATEVYAPADPEVENAISGLQLVKSDPNLLYFSTLDGEFGMHDLRTPMSETNALYQLSEKKIGGFSVHPNKPHFLATASLDRTMKLWDLRKISKSLPALVGEHANRLSVSHASFNSVGQVATASYDDTVKIYDFGACAKWSAGHTLSEEKMEPTTVVKHNNQTGRWVTILRAQWQADPQDGVQRFCIGNMDRFIDIYTSKGEQLAQLGHDSITAVPAVAQFHPTRDWVAGGNGSGKLSLFM